MQNEHTLIIKSKTGKNIEFVKEDIGLTAKLLKTENATIITINRAKKEVRVSTNNKDLIRYLLYKKNYSVKVLLKENLK